MTILKVSQAKYEKFTTESQSNQSQYNFNMVRPQFFAVLDASALLWHAREFKNPADSNRPKHFETGQSSDMHPWCVGLCETFLYARESFLKKYSEDLWETDVKVNPGRALPCTYIGRMCEESWTRHFPLLPVDHDLRRNIGKIRALDYMWGILTAYTPGSGNGYGLSGMPNEAWMPLSMAHQVQLLDSVGLFDRKYNVPCNPWLAHEGQGISFVFNQSYHTVYSMDNHENKRFSSWLKEACRYQPPSARYHPFTQYGGTPVLADFTPHRLETPDDGHECRHKQLMYHRFGFTGPLRLGAQFDDGGLLQDLYSFKYRPYANLSPEQREMQTAKAVYPSNFMAYARNHAIIAIASCNHGTESPESSAICTDCTSTPTSAWVPIRTTMVCRVLWDGLRILSRRRKTDRSRCMLDR